MHPDAGLAVAEHVHGFRGLEHHQAHGLDIDANARDHFDVLAELNDRFAKRFPGDGPLHEEVQRPLSLPDRAHAVMDASGAEPDLRDLEAAAFAEEHVRPGHPHVVQLDVHVAVGRVVLAKHGHGPQDVEAGGVHGYQDLRLLLIARRVRAGLDHADHDLAARVASAGDVVLLAVDDPLVAIEHGSRVDVLGIGRGHVGLRHAEAGTDLTGKKRLQPLLLLLLRADALQHLHVAGIGRGAVQGLGGQRGLAEFGCDVGVVQVLQPFAGLRVRQKEVPQP